MMGDIIAASDKTLGQKKPPAKLAEEKEPD